MVRCWSVAASKVVDGPFSLYVGQGKDMAVTRLRCSVLLLFFACVAVAIWWFCQADYAMEIYRGLNDTTEDPAGEADVPTLR